VSTLVFVVDDDPSIRRALARVLRCEGYAVETFGCASDLLTRDANSAAPSCVVLDVCMPGVNGLELQARLSQGDEAPAIVFLSGFGNVPTATDAMKAGAVDFLEKPFRTDALLAAVGRAVARDTAARAVRSGRAEVEARHRWLTRREREVMSLVVDGLPNKLIANQLGTSEKTIKVHRARVMTKMAAASLPDLVRMALKLDGDDATR
jgi:FixJ family two-component response regulator